MITYHLKISGQDPRVLYSDMEFVAGDVGAYRLVFSFFDENTPLSLSGKVLSVKIKRADGTVLSDSGTITNDTAVYIPKNDCFCVPGSVTFEIALMDSAKNYITTKIIHARVLKSIGEPSDTAGDNSSVFVTLLAQTKAQLDAANQTCDAARELLTQTQNSLTEKADKATSLSGYGITDAYTKTEVDEAIGDIETAKADKATTLSGYGIEDAYTKKEANDLYANALKATAIGSVVSLDDVSPLAHTLKVWAHSKNIVKPPFEVSGTNTINGVTYTINNDYSVTASGVPTASGGVTRRLGKLDASAYRGKIASIIPRAEVTGSYLYVHMFYNDGTSPTYNWLRSTKTTKMLIPDNASHFEFGIAFLVSYSGEETTIYPLIQIGETAEEWIPYVDVIGKNVLVNGEEYPINADGTVDGVQSIAPDMTLRTDTDGVVLNVEYNRDTNKVIESLISAIISLGGNI